MGTKYRKQSVTTISTNGQVCIPLKIRHYLGIKRGDTFQVVGEVTLGEDKKTVESVEIVLKKLFCDTANLV